MHLHESLKTIKRSFNSVTDNIEFVCGTALFGLLVPLLFYYWKNYRIVSVNCWACNKENHVIARESNKFTCRYCDQFNG